MREMSAGFSCAMLYVMPSPDPSTGPSWLSQSLGIGAKSYTGSTCTRMGDTDERGNACGSSQGNHFFHQNTSQRSDLHTLVLTELKQGRHYIRYRHCTGKVQKKGSQK